jgi:hypothetical protein
VQSAQVIYETPCITAITDSGTHIYPPPLLQQLAAKWYTEYTHMGATAAALALWLRLHNANNM